MSGDRTLDSVAFKQQTFVSHSSRLWEVWIEVLKVCGCQLILTGATFPVSLFGRRSKAIDLIL